MDKSSLKRKIFDFLNQHELCVLSTIDSDKNVPESAIVGFGQNESLELIFGTAANTRKYTNLKKNPNISLVTGWSSDSGSIQYEGIARELTNEKSKKYVNLLIQKNQDHKNFFKLPDQRYFLIKPLWIRFYDNAGNPPETHEIDF